MKTLKLILVLVLAIMPVALAAQTITLSAFPTSIKVGGTTAITLTLATTGTPITELQYQIGTGGFTGSALAPAVAAAGTITAGKSVQCSLSLLCLLAGINTATTPATLNNNPLAAGALVTHQLTVSGTAARPGTLTLSLTNILATDANVNPIAIPNATATIVVGPSPFDLNGDGVVDFTDVGTAITQALGTCGTADVNGDGKCNIVDVGLVIKAALGL